MIDPAILTPDVAQRTQELYEHIEAARSERDPKVGDTAAGLACIYIRELAHAGDQEALRDLACWIRERLDPLMMARMPVGSLTN